MWPQSFSKNSSAGPLKPLLWGVVSAVDETLEKRLVAGSWEAPVRWGSENRRNRAWVGCEMRDAAPGGDTQRHQRARERLRGGEVRGRLRGHVRAPGSPCLHQRPLCLPVEGVRRRSDLGALARPSGLPAEVASLTNAQYLTKAIITSALWPHCSVSHPDRACPSPWAPLSKSPLAPGPLGPFPTPLPDVGLPVPSHWGPDGSLLPELPGALLGPAATPPLQSQLKMQIPRSHQDHGPWHLNLDKLRAVRTRSQAGALPHCLGFRHLLCDASPVPGPPMLLPLRCLFPPACCLVARLLSPLRGSLTSRLPAERCLPRTQPDCFPWRCVHRCVDRRVTRTGCGRGLSARDSCAGFDAVSDTPGACQG